MRTRKFGRTGSISAHVIVRVVDYVAARGHDPAALCRSAGLQLAVLRQPDARVPYALAAKLGERATALTHDPNLGLHLAQDVRDTGRYDPGVLLLAASPNVRAALEHMVRYQRYWGDGERSRLVHAEEGLIVRYTHPLSNGVTQRHDDECVVAELVLGLRVLTAAPIAPRTVRFQHAAPRDQREHAALFSCPIEFTAPFTEALFDEATLNMPLRHASDFYLEVFRQQVERAIAQLPSERDFIAEVRAVVLATLPGGACTLAATARALGLTARTLQRRLDAEASSFDEQIEAVRRELSLRYLDQQLPVTEIANLLGYAEPSAFHRAFKRWTGTTPERARTIRKS